MADRLVPRNELTVVDTRGFVRTAGLLTIIAALAGAVSEIFLALTHPAILNLGIRPANALEGIAGGAVILITLISIAGLMRSNAAGNGGGAKIGMNWPLVGGLFFLGWLALGIALRMERGQLQSVDTVKCLW